MDRKSHQGRHTYFFILVVHQIFLQYFSSRMEIRETVLHVLQRLTHMPGLRSSREWGYSNRPLIQVLSPDISLLLETILIPQHTNLFSSLAIPDASCPLVALWVVPAQLPTW